MYRNIDLFLHLFSFFPELALASTTLFTNVLTWNDANQHCKSIGQHLVTIDEAAKQHLYTKHCWTCKYSFIYWYKNDDIVLLKITIF